ncbi:unnamed protein product [Phytophthora fragariaefolia]|uniref:Unnamed protein product n=1 Tax=Phytophthora fragariaefolia TaxID=1490495 RepID=A0A9W6U6L9_9STRA|nr:unnamed protein product [Phytophthora fragariaefolia]
MPTEDAPQIESYIVEELENCNVVDGEVGSDDDIENESDSDDEMELVYSKEPLTFNDQGAMARSAPGSDVGHGDAALAISGGSAAQGEPVDDRQERTAAPEAMQCDDEGVEEEELLLLCLLLVAVVVVLSQIDGRSIRRPVGEVIVVRTDFFPRLKANRSLKAYRRTVRCSPESFDKLQVLLEPLYYRKYGLLGKNTQHTFDYRLSVLLIYYRNGCDQDGDGIGGAANQLGMSRTPALRYIQKLEELLYGRMNDVVYFPAATADAEWDDMFDGFAVRGGDFPDVACIFDGTIVRTRRPSEHLVRLNLFFSLSNVWLTALNDG